MTKREERAAAEHLMSEHCEPDESQGDVEDSATWVAAAFLGVLIVAVLYFVGALVGALKHAGG